VSGSGVAVGVTTTSVETTSVDMISCIGVGAGVNVACGVITTEGVNAPFEAPGAAWLLLLHPASSSVTTRTAMPAVPVVIVMTPKQRDMPFEKLLIIMRSKLKARIYTK